MQDISNYGETALGAITPECQIVDAYIDWGKVIGFYVSHWKILYTNLAFHTNLTSNF